MQLVIEYDPDPPFGGIDDRGDAATLPPVTPGGTRAELERALEALPDLYHQLFD